MAFAPRRSPGRGRASRGAPGESGLVVAPSVVSGRPATLKRAASDRVAVPSPDSSDAVKTESSGLSPNVWLFPGIQSGFWRRPFWPK